MNPALIGGIFNIGEKLINHFFPDKEEQEKKKLELISMLQQGQMKELDSAMQVIVAEANSESWLARSWRPITMLIFVALVCAHWLGFTPENLPPDQVVMLLEIIKIGLGGYVIGRSAEKGIKAWKEK